MALQYVGGASGSGTSTDYVVSLASLTGGIGGPILPGDVIVVCSAFGSTASSAPVVVGDNSGAYTGLGAAAWANDSWDVNLRMFYAVQGSAVDTRLTIVRTTNAAYGGATVVHVWRGASVSAPINATGTPATTTNASRGNPPAVTPSVSGAIVISCGAGTQGASGSAFTVPSGLTNAVSVLADGSTSDIGVWIASAAGTSGVAYDPAAWTGGATSTSSSAAAQTIALAPQPALADSFTGDLGGTGAPEATFSYDHGAIADTFTGDLGAAGEPAATATRALAPAVTLGGTGSPAATTARALGPQVVLAATGSPQAAASRAFAPTTTLAATGSPAALFSTSAHLNDSWTGSLGATGSPAAVSSRALAPAAALPASGNPAGTSTRALVPACSLGGLAAAAAIAALSLSATATLGAAGRPEATWSASLPSQQLADVWTGNLGGAGSMASTASRVLAPATSLAGSGAPSAPTYRTLAPASSLGASGGPAATFRLSRAAVGSLGATGSIQAEAVYSGVLVTDPAWLVLAAKTFTAPAAAPGTIGVPARKAHTATADPHVYLSTPARTYEVIL